MRRRAKPTRPEGSRPEPTLDNLREKIREDTRELSVAEAVRDRAQEAANELPQVDVDVALGLVEEEVATAARAEATAALTDAEARVELVQGRLAALRVRAREKAYEDAGTMRAAVDAELRLVAGRRDDLLAELAREDALYGALDAKALVVGEEAARLVEEFDSDAASAANAWRRQENEKIEWAARNAGPEDARVPAHLRARVAERRAAILREAEGARAASLQHNRDELARHGVFAEN